MKILRSLASAFLMYSKIPMPQVEWKEENRRYALCFFPLVGAVVGALLLLWQFTCIWLNIGGFLKGAVSAVLPLLVTGGIHMDGFCDVLDARSSYADRERKLKIMKDPHVGSFAVMWLCVYLLLQAALFAEVTDFSAAAVISCGFVLSRALSGMAAVTFRSAKDDGTLQSFTKSAHKHITIAVLSLLTALACVGMVLSDPCIGILAILGTAGSFLFYRIFAYRQFGGITGDLAGWFLQICEIMILMFAVMGEKFMEVAVLWF